MKVESFLQSLLSLFMLIIFLFYTP